MTASQVLKLTKDAKFDVRSVFRFPYVHLVVSDDSFESKSDDDREVAFADRLDLSLDELRASLQNSLFTLRLLTRAESAAEYGETPKQRGHHWLGSLALQATNGGAHPSRQAPSGPRIAHFYGYKGGQGRSTVLALTAMSMAEDGWRVLAVDSDLEAPSLDVIFGRSVRPVSGTLLGVAQREREFRPERVRIPPTGGGYVDLLACRPKSAEYDIDAAAFALRSALDSTLIESAAQRIREEAAKGGYDAILIDHRAGISPATLPWMWALQGPVAAFARLDEQWKPAETFLRTVFTQNPDNPGLFVSWKPDDEDMGAYRNRNGAQVESLLDLLAAAIDSEEDLSSAELQDHWIAIPYDSSFRQQRLPELTSLPREIIEAVLRIRRLADLGGKPRMEHPSPSPLSPSGAKDAGNLIQTAVLRELLVPDNSTAYILGRKGTGKTRLLRELALRDLGEPLIVDAQSGLGKGLLSPGRALTQAALDRREDPDRFWWLVFTAAMKVETTESTALEQAFEAEAKGGRDPFSEIAESARRATGTRTFLIDSLETAFPGALMQPFLESLFRVLGTIDTDPRLSTAIRFKLFLRTDLAERGGFQNLEQQLHGRTRRLSWNTQLIFNFVLSRMMQIDWYHKNFAELMVEIGKHKDEIANGELQTDECEKLLLGAFPERLRRHNLQTTTFLKTYFSDTASEKTDEGPAYYPRVYDKFLEVIASPETGKYSGPQLDDNSKIENNLIIFAHEEAAQEYLNQLESELVYLIDLAEEHETNRTRVRSLLQAFAGLKTPFSLDEQIKLIGSKVKGVDKNAIRSALESMKRVGIFEDRPGYEGDWRVGRLFKSSLKMKFVR